MVSLKITFRKSDSTTHALNTDLSRLALGLKPHLKMSETPLMFIH